MFTYLETDKKYTDILEKLAEPILEVLGLPDHFEIDIALVPEEEIKQLNKEYRDKDTVTDVLSFPAVEFEFPYEKSEYEFIVNPETGRIMLGEIAVCGARMLEQAEEYGHSAEREFAFLTVHGVLHLFGFDHEDDEAKGDVMREKEKEILERAGYGRL